jgi:hypothetical protein
VTHDRGMALVKEFVDKGKKVVDNYQRYCNMCNT